MQEVVVRGEPFCMLALSPEGNVRAIKSADSEQRELFPLPSFFDAIFEVIERAPKKKKQKKKIFLLTHLDHSRSRDTSIADHRKISTNNLDFRSTKYSKRRKTKIDTVDVSANTN